MDLVVKNGNVFVDGELKKVDFLVKNGKIDKIDFNISGENIYDAKSMCILPGIIDAHVHYGMQTSNGFTADDFESGTLSAAFGGITTYIDFASPIASKSLVEALKTREKEAEKSYIDFSLHMEVTGAFEQDFDELKLLKQQGINSIKIYTTYGNTRLPDEKIKLLMEKIKENDMVLMIHAEDDEIVKKTKEAFLKEGKTLPKYHASSRPEEAETKSIELMISMAEKTGATIYIAHVSTGKGAELIREAKKNNLPVFCETCPHYLLLNDNCYNEEDAQKYIMTPPLRTKKDNDLLWEALADGTLDCAVTDHCSFTLKEKLLNNSCFTAIPGIGGSETLLPILYSEGVLKNKITLKRLVEILCENPAKKFGIYPKKGTIKVGSDADFVIFDTEKEVCLSGNMLHSKAGYTVFEGHEVKGYPFATFSKGELICENQKLIAKDFKGKFIKI